MPSTDHLEAAGRRAALGPVPTPPTIDALNAEVGRRQNRRRNVFSGVVVALVAAVAIPVSVALIDNDQPDLVTLASDGGAELASSDPAGLPDQVEPSTTSTSAAPTTTSATEETVSRGPFAGLNDENFDLRLDLGDESFAIVVISGDDAAARAVQAEAAADETREIDDQTVWIANNGDEVTASALFDDETFVEVRGPKQQIERILDLVSEHMNGPVMFFDPTEFAKRFDLPDGFLDREGFFGEDFSFEGQDNPLFPLFEDGTFDEFQNEMKDFAECMEITVDRSGSTTKVEIPNCELPQLDSLFGEDAFRDLPFDLNNLFEGLTDELEDAAAN